MFTIIIRPFELDVLLDCKVYPSDELEPDCRVISLGLNAIVDTTSENVIVNVEASRSISKSSSCGGMLSVTKTCPSLPSVAGARLFPATSVNASAVSER